MTLRIAVAGAGLIGRRHLELIADSDDCAVCAIVDPSPAATEPAAAAGVPVFDDLAALFDGTEKPDGVVLATPTPLHAAQCRSCIEAGVPVLVEKPLASTTEEGTALCREIEDRGATVLVGHHRVHSPILARARAVIAAGEIGDVVAVNGTALFYKPDDYFAAAPWRQQPGGGPILINLIHDIGNLRALAGEITAVQAFTANAARQAAVEDTAAVTLRFANGALGTFLLSDSAAAPWSWEQTAKENAFYAACDGVDCYVVAGTKGALAVPTLTLWRHGQGRERSWATPFETTTVAVTPADPLACQLAHFCDVIRGTSAPLVTARDGLQNLRVANAIAESAATGRVVATID